MWCLSLHRTFILFDPHMEQKSTQRNCYFTKVTQPDRWPNPTSHFQSALSCGQTVQMMENLVLDFKGHLTTDRLVPDLQLVLLFS